MDVANSGSWDNVHTGTIVGQGGGHQTHVRLTAGAYDYVLFEGQAGRLSDVAGRVYSGIAVLRDGKDVATLYCPGRAVRPWDWTQRMLSRVPAAARERVVRDEERFDEWF